MQDLAAASLLTSSGLTRLVDRLEQRALISRRAADTDQRGRACSATTAGADLVRRAQAQFLAALAAILRDDAGLARKELVGLADALDRIAAPDDRA
jgi:DNA-binding MarR family transcriptional regulator